MASNGYSSNPVDTINGIKKDTYYKRELLHRCSRKYWNCYQRCSKRTSLFLEQVSKVESYSYEFFIKSWFFCTFIRVLLFFATRLYVTTKPSLT